MHLSHPQTNYIVDWLAESACHFLGHTIVTIWPINNVYTIVNLLPFIRCNEKNRSSWPRKWKIPTNQETNNRYKSIIGLRSHQMLRWCTFFHTDSPLTCGYEKISNVVVIQTCHNFNFPNQFWDQPMDEILSPLVIIEHGCSGLVMMFCHHLILADKKVFKFLCWMF